MYTWNENFISLPFPGLRRVNFFSESRARRNKLISVDPNYDDDGIGTSDDETNSNSSTTTNKNDADGGESDARATPVDGDVDVEVEVEQDDEVVKESRPRRVIKPDTSALNRLLAFDEVCP